ncbi:MAG: ATP-binding cassette domain-containing protein [Roseobacter sp.]
MFTDASFDISRGEIIGAYGPSGVGKSTLVELCLGLLNHTSGAVD